MKMRKYLHLPIFSFAIFALIVQMLPTNHVFATEESRELVLNIPTLQLKLLKGGDIEKTYPVAVGKTLSQTPVGNFKIINKVKNPVWLPKEKPPVPPGPDNPLGNRWIGFYEGYGIHGNNNPKSIGTFVSLGCIRLHNKDVEELFNLVKIGDSVKIKYETIVTGQAADKGRFLEIYPDIYKLGTNSRKKVLDAIDTADIKISNEKLKHILHLIDKQKVLISPGYRLAFNGKLISTSGLISDDEIYFKYDTVKYLLENTFFLNVDKNLSINNYYGIPEKEINGVNYISVKDLTEFLDIDSDKLIINHNDEKIDITVDGMVFLNDSYLTADMFFQNDQVYLPLRKLGNALGSAIYWDSKRDIAMVGENSVEGIIFGGKTYISLSETEKLFNVEISFDKERNKIEIRTCNCLIEGRQVDFSFIVVDAKPYLPLRSLANMLGYSVGWHDGRAYINNKEVPVYLNNGISYISLDESMSRFGISIEFNSF